MSCAELERLYDSHAAALFGVLLQWTRDEGETRELLQELFCRLAARPEVLEGIRDERGYLIRLACNKAIDRMRRRATRDRVLDAYALEHVALFEAAIEPDAVVFQRQLEEALGELPEDQRVVVHLKLWEGWTFDRIAGVLEIPLNTAASRYRYGLDKLRSRLRPLYDEIR